jgi:hypothetical protein
MVCIHMVHDGASGRPLRAWHCSLRGFKECSDSLIATRSSTRSLLHGISYQDSCMLFIYVTFHIKTWQCYLLHFVNWFEAITPQLLKH